MDTILRSISLTGRTIQGITPIFVEYALWIAILGVLLFVLGEVFVRIVRYRGAHINWVATAFGVHPHDVLPVPSQYLLGMETQDRKRRKKNPFGLSIHSPDCHQGDYIIRGAEGAAFVSVYNWRNSRASSPSKREKPGLIQMPAIRKSNLYTGFRKETWLFSPDEDIKAKAATLNVHILNRFSSQARICALCLHKNRPFDLITRTAKRDIHGRLAAHIDIEQIADSPLPTGDGGYIDDETWHDLRKRMLSQPSRMNMQGRTFFRILLALGLLAAFHQFEGSTISSGDIEEIIGAMQGQPEGGSQF